MRGDWVLKWKLLWSVPYEIFSRYDWSCKLSGKVVFLCFLAFFFLFSIRLELQVIRKGCMLIYGEEALKHITTRA